MEYKNPFRSWAEMQEAEKPKPVSRTKKKTTTDCGGLPSLCGNTCDGCIEREAS